MKNNNALSKRRWVKQALTLLLCVALMLGLAPGVGMSTAKAETDASATNTAKDINLGTACIKAGDKIYFGKYLEKDTAYNVRWIVLEDDVLYQSNVETASTTGEKPSVLSMLSEYAVGWQQFRGDNGNYTDSFLKTRLDDYYNDDNSFSNIEKRAVADTTLTAESIGGSTPTAMFGQKLFPISTEEARKLGFGSDILITKNIIDPNGKNVWWGLRTNWQRNESVAAMNTSGDVQGSAITNGDFIRPACHLDQSSVLFTSENSAGKSSFAEVGSNNVSENSNTWKLTLKDSSKTVNVTSGAFVSQSGQTVTVPYTYTGDDVSQISIMITDKDYTESDASILYYGALDTTLDETKEGTGTFELPDGLPAGYKIYMMAEDTNGENSTDYSSMPVEINPTKIFDAKVNNGTGGGSYPEGATVTITADASPIGKEFDKWTVVSGGITLEDATSASTTFTMPAGAVEVTATYKPVQMLNTYVSAGATQIKLNWSKVKGADGYYIYGNRCGKSLKKLKTVKGTTWTQKNLKKGGIYKYQVKAYQKTKNGTKILKTSLQVHVATLGSKKTNAKSIRTNFTNAVLKKGATKQIYSTTIKRDPKEKLVNHVSKYRYRTNCSKIATVSKSGKIKAVGKGTCNIYVYANNGVFKKLTVHVK